MTLDKEQVLQMATDAGFVGYGEEMGEYCIPAPAFIARLERVIEAAMCAGRAQGLRDAREVCGQLMPLQSSIGRVFALEDCAAAIKQLEGK